MSDMKLDGTIVDWKELWNLFHFVSEESLWWSINIMPHNQVISFRAPLKQLAWMVFRDIGAANAVWEVMIASELPLVGFVVL